MKPTMLYGLLLLAVTLAACGNGESAAAAAAEGHEERAHEEGGGRVKLTDEQLQAADIGLAKVGPGEIRTQLPLYGVVAPNAENVRDVAARFPGIIRSVSKRVGDAVRPGDVLATVESNESLQTYRVVAPIAGVVTARHANPGEQTGERSLFTVANLATVWVELALFPRDLPKVRVGQTVRVKATDGGLGADGKVVYVAPFGTSANQTLNARVLLDNALGKWAPGLYVTAEVTTGSASVPLAVASLALQTLEQGSVVFVKAEEGFEPRSVRLGRSDGFSTEVIEGVQNGDTYVTKNSFILKAELGKGEAAHAD